MDMKIRLIRLALAAGLGASIAGIPLLSSAHHSFASEFDREQPFRIEGAVKSIDWTNPHGWLHVDVEEEGEVVTYDLELPSPSTLARNGWRRNDLVPGDRVVVTGFRARTRYHVGRAAGISRENGEAVFGGGVSDEDLSR
jgi:hypothetical protein